MTKSLCRLILFLLILLLIACNRESPYAPAKKSVTPAVQKKELLIYCGITMIKPMSEIAAIIEKKENCTITITKGGSGNLLKSLLHNQIGDLYLPGSDKYYLVLAEEYPDLVKDKVKVGENKAVIMLQKGNPKHIPPTLDSLTNPEYAVVIGNPDSGSIGKESGKILRRKGIYQDVVKNAMYLTTDSKDLVKAIKRREADIVINWFAASTWDDNPKFIDVVEIDPQYAEVSQLVLGLLKFSPNPELARKFMQFAASAEGQGIFRKHGLLFNSGI